MYKEFIMEKSDVKDGKFIKDYSNEKDLYCFRCDVLGLTTLEGCPKECKEFICRHNNLISLQGCPEKTLWVELQNNPLLKDISDLPPMVNHINLKNCNNVKIFTKNIETETGELAIACNKRAKKLRERIKNWKYYEVVHEFQDSIYVKQKALGKTIIEDI